MNDHVNTMGARAARSLTNPNPRVFRTEHLIGAGLNRCWSQRIQPRAPLLSTSPRPLLDHVNAHHYILATAGPVDQQERGQALTGTDPDLPEKPGITIDLGFAHLDSNSQPSTLFHLGIVDCAAKDFIEHGGGRRSIDLALFIVATTAGCRSRRNIFSLTPRVLAPSWR